MSTDLNDLSASKPAAGARLSKSVAALIGVLSLVAALAAGHLIAAFTGLNASPYLAVGNAAIDLTPLPVKNFAVETFGTKDKLVLLAGMAVVMVLLAAVAGVLSRGKPLPGQIVIGLFGVVGILAVFSRPDLGQISVTFNNQSNQLAIAGNAESIPIWEFLLLDHSRSELGKERCLTLA